MLKHFLFYFSFPSNSRGLHPRSAALRLKALRLKPIDAGRKSRKDFREPAQGMKGGI
jgi:hypothetical protein